jgi:Zn-dependent protease with chaperone function
MSSDIIPENTVSPDTYPVPNLADYIKRRKEGYTPLMGPGAAYAHPIDAQILKTLNNIPLRAALNRAINYIVKFQATQLLSESIYVSPKTFPDEYRSLVNCAKTLGIPVPRMLMGHNNMYAIFTTGTDNDAFIYMSTQYSHVATEPEKLFVIAHECGHIHNEHVSLRVLTDVLINSSTQLPGIGPIILAILRPFAYLLRLTLLAWSRRSEITCDRAGLVVCKDLKVAEMALLRLLLGFENVAKIDVEDVLNRMEEAQRSNEFARPMEILRTHPNLLLRIRALRLFAKSELYHEVTGLPRPSGEKLLTRKELDDQTEALIGEFKPF